MIRFSAKEISIEVEASDDVAELLQLLLTKLVAQDTEKRPMTDAERSKKYRESKKHRDENVTLRDENVTDNVTEQEKEEKEKKSSKRKEKEEKELINTFAIAKVQTDTNDTQNEAKTDSSFWQFAKENAELAEAFHNETGLKPIKSQFGRWVNDLRDLREADISIDRMKKTVAYMRSKDLPISSPGSLLKTAQYLKARGSVPTQGRSSQKEQINEFPDLYTMMKAREKAGFL